MLTAQKQNPPSPMDSVSLTSQFRSFTPSPRNDFLTNPLSLTSSTFSHLTNSKKPRTSIVASSSSSSSDSTPSSNLSLLFPFWNTIKQSAISRTQRWISSAIACSDTDEVADGYSYKGCYLQNGGLGIALMSVTTNAKVRISPFLATLAANPTFVSGLLAWIIAQSIKVILNFFVERKWDLRLLFASGGMPSSHSALCTALTTSVALCHGISDSLFPVCLGFSLIVMYDAIGVRRHAGMQAEVLNMIVADLFEGHPMSERKLKEFLGHTPSQVLAGALLGTLVAFFCCGAYVAVT